MGVEGASGTTGYLDYATDFSYMLAAKATTRRVRAQNRKPSITQGKVPTPI
jgi:hypothetical protein